MDIVSLRNPCTEGPARYLHAKHLSLFFELMCFNEAPRSWFIGKRTCANGKVYMTNAFDPLFWGLYYIRLNCVHHCVPIEQAMIDDNFENTHLILDVLPVEQLSMVSNNLDTHSDGNFLTNVFISIHSISDCRSKRWSKFEGFQIQWRESIEMAVIEMQKTITGIDGPKFRDRRKISIFCENREIR